MKDVKTLAASGMDFAHEVWLDPLLDSEFGVVWPHSAFLSPYSEGSGFPHINVEDVLNSLADAERSHYQCVSNDSAYTKFSSLWDI